MFVAVVFSRITESHFTGSPICGASWAGTTSGKNKESHFGSWGRSLFEAVSEDNGDCVAQRQSISWWEATAINCRYQLCMWAPAAEGK